MSEQQTEGGALAPIGVEALALRAQEERETSAILAHYGFEHESLDQVIGTCRRILRESAEGMIEVGRAILAFRELPRGGYSRAIEAIGLSEGTARRLANVALKFLGHNHRRPLLNLDRCKVYELALLDGEALDDLAADPAKLDQVERMSMSELRKSLRESQCVAEAKDRVIREVQQENAQLREREARRTEYTPDEMARETAKRREARLRAVQDAIFKVLQDFTAIGNAVQVISEEGDSEEWEKVSLDCRWLAQEISHRYVQHRIAVDFNEVITPSWLRAAQ